MPGTVSWTCYLSDMMPPSANSQQRHAEETMMMQISEAKASVNLCNTITDVGEDDDLSDGDLAAVSMPLLRVFSCMAQDMQMPAALHRCTRHGRDVDTFFTLVSYSQHVLLAAGHHSAYHRCSACRSVGRIPGEHKSFESTIPPLA